MRLCTRCNERKEEDEFNRKSKLKDTGVCRNCNRITSGEYYSKNKKELLSRGKKYRQDNSEIIKLRDSRKYYNNKEYINKRNAQYYQNNKDHIKEKAKQWAKDNRDKRAGYNKEYARKYPEKARAKDLVYKALKSGELVKEPCLACRLQDRVVNSEGVEGHHPDYSMPLNVIWLCEEHHGQVHLKHK